MCPTFISHICSFKRIHIEIYSMHSNYFNLSFYRNTSIDSGIWWMYPIWVEKFETTGKIRSLQILHDGQDFFTTDIARRARFSDKNWREGQEFYYVLPNLSWKVWDTEQDSFTTNLARRAKFFYDRFTRFGLKRLTRRARFFYYKLAGVPGVAREKRRHSETISNRFFFF